MEIAPARLQVEIIEDWHDCLAVFKPAGWLTVPGRGHKENTPVLSHVLGEQLRQGQARQENDLYVVHRLDEATSGVVVFARTAEAHRELNTLFETREVKKAYWCLVTGVPQAQLIDLPLFKLPSKKVKSVVDTKGKPSQTLIKVVATRGAISLIEAQPLTGRSHQIRVHLAHLGFPLLGDRLYGGAGTLGPADLPYPLLHSRQISFERPGGRPCSASAPLSGLFQKLYCSLGFTEA